MENDSPIVSILVPLYNHEEFVLDCLEGIKNEGYPSLELIIMDDGSKDNSLKVASDWLETNKHQFIDSKILSQENQGVVKTLNTLLSLSTGEFCLLLASDDILIQNTISARVRMLQSHENLLAVFSDSMPIDVSGNKLADSSMEYLHNSSKSAYRKRTVSSLILEWGICGAVILAKRDAWDPKKGVGPYPENLEFDDRWFYLKLASKGRIKFIDMVVSKYRVSQNSLSRNPNIDNEDEAINLVKSEFRGINYFLAELVHRFHSAKKTKPKSLKTKLYYVLVYSIIRRIFRAF